MSPQAAQAPNLNPESLNPLRLMLNSSGVVLVVLLLLIVASTLVWVIWFLKSAQLSRLRKAQHEFEKAAETATTAADLVTLAMKHKRTPGGRVVIQLAKRHQRQESSSELLTAVAKRAIAAEEQKVMTLMPMLSSIASSAPFIGLFGTVWGIMDAFLRIGLEKSASLPVVAPAIGEALIATAFGLVAAIPASIGFNFVDKRIGDLLTELAASADTWVATLVADSGAAGAVPLVRESFRATSGH